MRAVTLTEFGKPEVMKITPIDFPQIQAGTVLVKVEAVGINRADVLQRQGKYPPPAGESDILGLEVSGVISDIADDVSGWSVGDRVCALVGSGAYAEYCAVDAGMLMPMPQSLSFEQAAAIPEAFLTAMQALFTLGELSSNESVLIHAGASGVGTAAVQLAKSKSATVFFTAGSDAKIEKVKSLGGDVGINYKQQTFRDEILQHTQERGVDVILDFIGAAYFDDNIQCLAKGGRLINIAMMQGSRAELSLRRLISYRLQIKGLIMRSRRIEAKREMTQRFVQHFLPLFDQQLLQPVVDATFSIEQVAEAHQYMEDNKNTGKIILSLQR
ncbi:MAG: NAD(P)H-quinone oxidoreductase [Coxiellaceae bacterium]|nr:NAD(P)H-quinone oxidoreductase [Coxiellaceae bacterium]